jgi:hypothetical protein
MTPVRRQLELRHPGLIVAEHTPAPAGRPAAGTGHRSGAQVREGETSPAFGGCSAALGQIRGTPVYSCTTMALIYFGRFQDPTRGIWVETSNIAYVEPITADRCMIHFVSTDPKKEVDGSAEDVARRVNVEGDVPRPKVV